MEYKHTSGVVWFILITILLLGLVWILVNNDSQNNRFDLVEARYDTKVVYTEQASTEDMQRDCANRNGTFNECGSGCSPSAEVCTAVCVPICELNGSNTTTTMRTGWQAHTDTSQIPIVFNYPQNANISYEAGRVKVTVLGPNNATGTEITDGFTLTMHPVSTSSTSSAQGSAQEAFLTVRAEGENNILEDLRQSTVADREVYTFTARSGLGSPVTYVYVSDTDRNAVIEITYSIAGDSEEDSYQSSVDNIIGTVRYSDEAPFVQEVSIALLDTERVTTGNKERGCDYVVLHPADINPTQEPLSVALERLFAYEETEVAGYYNFISQTKDTLSFDRARVEEGTAHIYLTGQVSGLSGVCDDPRTRIQIEETALQFDTVSDVELYLNEESTTLTPNTSQ